MSWLNIKCMYGDRPFVVAAGEHHQGSQKRLLVNWRVLTYSSTNNMYNLEKNIKYDLSFVLDALNKISQVPTVTQSTHLDRDRWPTSSSFIG